jgi:hypothetical protein
VNVDDDDLTVAICELLQDAGAGVWDPTGAAYTAGTTAIWYGALGTTPHRGIAVAVYAPVVDDVQNGLTARRVQLRSRGAPDDPRGANQIAGLAFTALHRTIRSRGVAFGVRQSFARLGPDGSRRQERTDNYTITLDNPEA